MLLTVTGEGGYTSERLTIEGPFSIEAFCVGAALRANLGGGLRDAAIEAPRKEERNPVRHVNADAFAQFVKALSRESAQNKRQEDQIEKIRSRRPRAALPLQRR